MNLFDFAGYGDEIWGGLLLTLGVGAGALVVAVLFGLIGAAGKLSRHWAWQKLAFLYTTLVRGIPELVLIIVLYYGVPTLVQNLVRLSIPGYRLDFNPAVTAVVVIGLIYGAFMTEVFRGAFLAVPAGQMEAARAFGMSRFKTFWRIHMPQMWRFALPGIGNVWMVLIKATALVSVIGLHDTLYWSSKAGEALHEPFKFFLIAALIFLGITFVSEQLFRYAESRAQRGVQKVRH
jgi:His/Glu/Gln/Arg/opine family amino acid ABC transporter permease subunit